MKFIDFFDRIFVISLESRLDRRKGAARELERIGMPFNSAKVELFLATPPPSAGSFPGIGARGCFESHLAVLKKAQMRGLSSVLVIEDDVAFSEKFLRDEDRLVDQLSQTDWDLVHFGYSPEQVGDQDADSVARIYPFFREIISTVCYCVSGRVLNRLISYLESLSSRPPGHFEGGPMPIDGAYNVFRWRYPDIVRRISIPTVAHQRSSRSDVYPDLAWFDRTPIIRDIATGARSLGLPALGRGLASHWSAWRTRPRP